jgi:hypothetical protein
MHFDADDAASFQPASIGGNGLSVAAWHGIKSATFPETYPQIDRFAVGR